MPGSTCLFLPKSVQTSRSWQCGCIGVPVGKMPKYFGRDESAPLTGPASLMCLSFVEFSCSNSSYHLSAMKTAPPEEFWVFFFSQLYNQKLVISL